MQEYQCGVENCPRVAAFELRWYSPGKEKTNPAILDSRPSCSDFEHMLKTAAGEGLKSCLFTPLEPPDAVIEPDMPSKEYLELRGTLIAAMKMRTRESIREGQRVVDKLMLPAGQGKLF